MLSTDRWLWLLQMALFLAVPVTTIILVIGFYVSGQPESCGNWIYTDAQGAEYRVRQEECTLTERELLRTIVGLMLEWLTFIALGTIIFCLRRIGRAMGAR
ncbi:MAG: hypothetical protein Q4G26_00670 [Paracoccus sp. (in: a-proteobacteria)]|nr:hypothetical protein [Paracoccus sp. (in: a-proteobacteria)]